MWELRWVLLALGVVLIAAVWVWSGRSDTGGGKSAKPAKSRRRAWPRKAHTEGAASEPAEGVGAVLAEAASNDDATASGDPEAASDGEAAEGSESGNGDDAVHEQATAEKPAAEKAEAIDRVIAIRCQIKQGTLPVERLVLTLRAAGLEHGRYDIYHRHAEDAEGVRRTQGEPLFSVANLTEPGSFDLDRASEATTAGITLFMVLPGHGDAVERFDMMTRTAHDLAGELDAELHDESGSFWSIQRERYVRDEVILYGLRRETG